MNRLAFQTYGTKKLSLFQSVWDTTETSAVGTELANTAATTPLPVGWAGANLLTGGYTHTAGNTASLLVNNLTPIAGQSYRIICTLLGTGSVVINWGGMSSVAIFATTTITLNPINITSKLSITPSNDFVGTVSLSIKQSSSATNQIQLPISIASGKSIWVDWGDGQYSTMNSANFYANRIHTYTASGEYPVRVFGDNFNFGFGSLNSSINDRLKIKSISSWGKLRIGLEAFSGCSNVTMSGITDIPDLTGVTNFQYLFGSCVSITSIGRINEWNTSSVTSMNYTFSGSENFNSNISNWDVSNVLNMTSIFNGAAAFNQNLSNWERVDSTLSKVTNFGSMFQGATAFNNGFASGVVNQLPWNINTTAASVSMLNMFKNASAFNSNLGTGTIPWDVSKVNNFTNMFSSTTVFTNGEDTAPINNWNIGGNALVTEIYMYGMFTYSPEFNRNISSWNVSKVTSFTSMFQNATKFNNGFASTVANQLTWMINTSPTASVNMSLMFQNATAFNSNLGTGTTPWNVGRVTSFASMFLGASNFNNGDEADVTKSKINDWSINTVSDVSMANMFYGVINGVTAFNREISKWNMSKVTSLSGMFWWSSAFNNGLNTSTNPTTGRTGINGWNINTSSPVTMDKMFAGTKDFNRPLLDWDTSTVTTMDSMFYGVTNYKFNQDISKWNVGNVTSFTNMFTNSFAFNNGSNSDTNPITGLPGINGWNINTTAASVSMASMFSSATAFNRNISGWNTSKVNTMNGMFAGASIFNNGYLSAVENQLTWDTSACTNMGAMFSGAPAFNSNLGTGTTPWNVSKVTTFARMCNAANFNNGDETTLSKINDWSIGGDASVTTITMTEMFQSTTAFNREISGWNMTKVNNTSNMFFTSIFNQPLANWERAGSTMSSVTDMSNMFRQNTVFNQPVGNWNTISVTNMSNMFFNSYAFDKNIGNWNVSSVNNFAGFMSGKTNLNFSSTNLDAIYNGWIVNGVQPNTTSPLSTNISFGTAKYTAAGTPGKNILLAAPNNWIIQDGGI